MTNNHIQIQPGLTSKRLATYFTVLYLPLFIALILIGKLVIGAMNIRTPFVGWLYLGCFILLSIIGFFLGAAFGGKAKAEKEAGYTTRLSVLNTNPNLTYVRTTRAGYPDPNLPPQLEKFDFKLHTETE